ncbi:uncharacterized protein PFL1_00802 [Pseudozyma flocculosa PF-1]|uniref:Related to PRP3 - essential splicing factor n=1 Tax=Pseudozyma flocculosa TaxID=84751 RepID=A0A5C3F5P7_9BASI|nr:uncharacterized protein PFL1_00802 [Pseudozyma flocculosa PF-1]EPQ31467.1 hypothetical protein PFL1_00802 [Pseudozyma flocculosa PF-1]SPO38749.1 related to PRP3 - essential splicing factor [Pseudozyma flocculosa]
MPPKRPLRNVFGDADDDDDDPSLSSTKPAVPQKRTKTGTQPVSIIQGLASSSSSGSGISTTNKNGAVPASAPSSGTSSSTSGVMSSSVQAQIEAARARIQAQMSNLAARPAGVPPSRPPQPPQASPTAATPAVARSTPAAAPRPPPSARPAAPVPSSLEDIQRKVAEAKARLLAQQGLQHAQRPPAAPTSTISSATTAPPPSAKSETPKAPPGIHPLLLGGDAAKIQEQVRSVAPKFASLQANARPSTATSGTRGANGRGAVPPRANPYLADSIDAAASDSGADQPKPKPKSMHKGFSFHRPGRHIQEAEEVRREAQMEDLKRRIQESARKAGLQDDLAGDEKVLQRLPPPDVEWWDIGLLPNKSYDDVPDDEDVATMLDKGKARETTDVGASTAAAVTGPLLYGKDSPIDPYVQHPIPIPAPSDQIKVAPAGVRLTKKEMKKMRRQRRAAEQQDKRDRIKMGLLPPDPPKVKLSNLMRVLTSEAVADPTKVEARVRREILARKEAHERANAERKLTPEQRKEKALRKVEQDEAKGIGCQVYRIKHLVAPWHKKKVRYNAQDYHLTGLTIFNPSFALVIVEGASKGLKGFKRLMTVRIDWTDPGRMNDGGGGGGGDDDDDDGGGGEGSSKAQVTAAADVGSSSRRARFDELATRDASEVDLAENRCELIFEGPLRERNFASGFRAVACPNDHSAKEVLGPKLEGYWDLARRWVPPEEDGL